MNNRTDLSFRLTGFGGAMALALAAFTAPAAASITITQSGAAAPTYTTTLNFDEPGGPTGADVPANAWAGSHNITSFVSGAGANAVGDNSAATGQGTNSYWGPFGVFINFGQDLTALSMQAWDNSGQPTPFGGGAAMIALNDGIEVGSLFVTPAIGGAGDSWYHITTTGGSVFDEVRFLGFAFAGPNSYVDNLSWNAVPEPTSLSLLALGAIGLLSRRRR